MASSHEKPACRRLTGFIRRTELLYFGSLILLSSLCHLVSSQVEVLSPEYVSPGGNVTFLYNGFNNLYGNNVTLRSAELQDSARKCWVDNETPLPAGVLIRFYIYIHSLSSTIDAQSLRLRLQIWREMDASLPSYLLVWQQLVQINFTSTGALYSFRINTAVTVEAGDKIGFTNEGNYGPISFTYAERRRTCYANVNVTNATGIPKYPLTGDVVTFDYTYLPSIFSIAVEVNKTLLGSTGPYGTGPYATGPYATGATEATGAVGATGSTGPYASTEAPPISTSTAATSTMVLSPEYVSPGGNITFYYNGIRNLYGNNVTLRAADIEAYAQNSWVDYESSLPAGVLVRFYIYIHSLSSTIDAQCCRLRLQIWRETDPNINSFQLVWQQRVQINYTSTGALYSFRMNTEVTVEAGDKIGFTNEGNYGPISLTYAERHRTYYARVNVTNANGVPNYPVTGDVVTFDVLYLPSIFSIAVQVDPILSPEYVSPGGNVTFLYNGINNFYGNNVTLRSGDLQESARKCWVDNETRLPAGVLVWFFIYIHGLSPIIDAQSYYLRLQIWRDSDPSIPSFQLVWQQRVQINFTSTGALYSFRMKTAVTVEAGDRIGFTNEGNYGPISFTYAERRRTYFAKVNLTNATGVPNYPLTGDVVTFEYTYLPSIFSIAVEVDPTLPGPSAPPAATGATGAVGITRFTAPYASTETPKTTASMAATTTTGASAASTFIAHNGVVIAAVAIAMGVLFCVSLLVNMILLIIVIRNQRAKQAQDLYKVTEHKPTLVVLNPSNPQSPSAYEELKRPDENHLQSTDYEKWTPRPPSYVNHEA